MRLHHGFDHVGLLSGPSTFNIPLLLTMVDRIALLEPLPAEPRFLAVRYDLPTVCTDVFQGHLERGWTENSGSEQTVGAVVSIYSQFLIGNGVYFGLSAEQSGLSKTVEVLYLGS